MQTHLGKALTDLTQIKPEDDGFVQILGDYWSRINGLDNTKGAPYAMADHVVTLDGMSIKTIWASAQLPFDSAVGIIIMGLGK